MQIVCADMEGVFTPEIWINVAERTGIDELRLTTRDISDYDELMQRRLRILDANGLTLGDITAVIAGMAPLPGAAAFLNGLRARVPVIIVSDTFEQFAGPLLAQLGYPTLFCHSLIVDGRGRISGYRLRQTEAKRRTVEALKSLNYSVIAFGDSYNDVGMLQAADHGILFKPPANVIEEFPAFPVTDTYGALTTEINRALDAPAA